MRADQFPTADGISYLEAKNFLLLNYCQSLVYYLLRKAKGFSIEGHPVVLSLVEIRLFLEKVFSDSLLVLQVRCLTCVFSRAHFLLGDFEQIRPIDKKLQYQIQKLTRVNASATTNVDLAEKETDASEKTEDLLKYRPNPDMLVSKTDETNKVNFISKGLL